MKLYRHSSARPFAAALMLLGTLLLLLVLNPQRPKPSTIRPVQSPASTWRGEAATPKPLAAPSAEVPKGLAASDWASIQQVYERQRRAAVVVGNERRARNHAQQWLTRFDGRGFAIEPDSPANGEDWRWGLELQSYGFPGHERAISGRAQVGSDGERVTYDWDAGLQEWFVNDRRGLEHGFTLERRPAGAGERLELRLAVRGGLRPRVLADGRGVSFADAQGCAVVNYTGLKVYDADGRALAAGFVAEDGALRLTVDESGARYPITIDPTAQQAYLKASNTGASDYFGNSVAVSGDTVVVGAYQEDSNTTGVNGDQTNNSAGNSGAAYVFVRSGATWSQQAYLKASNTGADDRFGISVAVAGDTVVVGAFQEASNATGVNGDQANNSASAAGAAYVFVRSGATWSQQAYLKASNTGASDGFGWSVAVAGDTVVVGALYEDSNATGVNGDQTNNSSTDSGAAYAFVRSGTTWSQQAYLKASNTGADDWFGTSVAVAGDTVVVGANLEASNATGVNGDQTNNSAGASGAVYVFLSTPPTLSISKSAPSPALTVGQNSTYTITVTNNGSAAATTATVKDAIPSDFDLISAGGAGWTCTPSSATATVGTVTCTFSGTIAALGGTNTALSIVVRPYAQTSGMSVTNRVSIDPTGGSDPPNPNVCTAANTPDEGCGALVTGTVGCPTSFTVNNLGDAVDANSGNGVCETAAGNSICTLRAAIGEANAIGALGGGCSPFTINFSVTGTINLASFLGALNHPNLTINGPGVNQLTVRRNSAFPFRIFVINNGKTVSINNLTISNGADTNGGGIDNGGGNLTINGCAIIGNAASNHGGGLHNSGGMLTVNNSTLSGNTAVNGGGFSNDGGTATLTNCTISSNTVSSRGGGLANFGSSNDASLTLLNSTVAFNTSNMAGEGGGIHNLSQGSAGSTATTNLKNTIFANNTSENFFNMASGSTTATLNSQGNNISSDMSATSALNQPGDQNNVNPALAPLGNYGGPTQTHALLCSSPAINAGANTGAPATDQRGVARPISGTVDIGAFEANPVRIVLPMTLPNGAVGSAYSQSLNLDGGPAPYNFVVASGSLPNGLSLSSGGLLSGTPTGTGSFSFTVLGTEANGGQGCRSYTLIINPPNTAPTFTSVTTPSRQQGSSATNSQIAVVSDAEDAEETLQVQISSDGMSFGNLATLNGVTVTLTDNNPGATGSNPNAMGQVFADVVAACGATNASFTLKVTDNGGAMATATLMVTVNSNTAPTVGVYANTTLVPGGSVTVTPNAAPTDNGSIMSVMATAAPGSFSGGFSGNAATGAVMITNANPPGVYTVTVTVADNCGLTTTRMFTLTVNSAPTITAINQTRQQSDQSANVQVATAMDAEDEENNLIVTVNSGASATTNGVTVSSFAVNASGQVTANVVANCTASNASFTLTVTDTLGATADTTLMVTVTANPPPVVGNYPNTTVATGGSITVMPDAAPTDNNTVASVTVTASPANFNGSFMGNTSTGGVTITAANPPGSYTVTVTLTDNCGATTTRNFTLTVSACGASLSKQHELFAANGGTGSFNVTIDAICNWTATSNNPDWLTVTAPTGTANGNGTVFYTVASHSNTSPRQGSITVAGQTFHVLQGARFNDVTPDHPFYNEIGKLSALGITAGCGNGNYCAEANTTREQMAIFIERALGVFNPPPGPVTPTFADVPNSGATDFSYEFIEDFATRGITQGCAAGPPRLYCPTANVTREQMAAFMIRARGEFNPPTPNMQRFNDVPPTNPFYNFIDRMAVLGITLGCNANPPLYCPTQFVTRAQMAAFLIRAFAM
jgi:CSLREA domain-containing protein